MNLLALEAFVVVADNGGFSSAERRSGRSKATLSRHVRELEGELGLRLFDRDSRALRLTQEGETLYGRVRGPLMEVAEAEMALRSSSREPHGLLRVSAPVLFSELALGAISASYIDRYPAVHLALVPEDRMASPVKDALDVIIRVNPGASDGLVGKCFFRDRHHVIAPAGLLAEGPPSRNRIWPSVLIAHHSEQPWPVTTPQGPISFRHTPALRTPSMLTAYHAVLGGIGISRLPWFMVADDVAQGRLVDLGEDETSEVAIWALHPSARLPSRTVTTFIDHLSACFPNGRWPMPNTPSPIPALQIPA